MTPIPQSFSLPQRVLHWTTVLLVLFNLLASDDMEHWWRAVRHGTEPAPDLLAGANLHAYVGIAILAVAVLRLALRHIQGVPADPAVEPAPFRLLARITHFGLYALLIGMPIAGMAAYYGGIAQAGELHGELMKTALWILIGLHVAGALVHQFYWKTNVLRRMTVGG
ncbi:cytochrome b [Rhizobium sp. YIM 134829]|uniref:cytochrome b n=1 Tax=Rhizobium sp. YIM 134829 TaxID=3390453 RepID=UPI00397C45E4